MADWRVVILFTLGLLAACSALTPRLDEQTGTTLAQRCVDYRLTVAALQAAAAERDLSDAETIALQTAQAFLVAYCPLEPAPAAETQ